MRIGLPSLLGLIFIVLKLTGFITWSWVWVLAPFWISILLCLTFALFTGIIVALAAQRDFNNKNRRNF